MIQLNILPQDKASGVPLPAFLIDARAYDPNTGAIKPIEPALRGQTNYYNGSDSQPYPFGPVVVYGTVRASGYVETLFGPVTWDGKATLDIPVPMTQGFRRPAAEARGPLPAFESIGPGGETVWTTLPATASGIWTPQGQQPVFDVRIRRANSWAVTIPDLPWVPGASSKHPERCLSWFLDRWAPDWQRTILQTHGTRGLSHFRLSVDDSMGPVDNGPDSPPGNAQTLDQYVATSRLVRAYGFFVEHMLASKYFSPHNQTLAQYQARVEPVFDALVAAGAIQVAVVGWEWNLWNIPGDGATYPIIGWLAQKCQAAGVILALHFSTYVTQWGNNGQEEDDFWTELERGNAFGPPQQVQALCYQGNATDDAGLMSAHINDVQRSFGRTRTSAVLWADELQADLQFDADQPDEDHSDLRGFETLCTPGPVPIMGFGEGARWPSGSVL